MKTTQERRMAGDEMHAPYCRNKRNASNLANAWDDIIRSDIKMNSWKKYKRKQWQKD